MFEKITLRLFLMCLVSCASMILYAMWVSKPDSEPYFKTVATFFIVGLANFLFWLITFFYTLRRLLRTS